MGCYLPALTVRILVKVHFGAMLYGGTKTKHKPQELKFSERKCEKMVSK